MASGSAAVVARVPETVSIVVDDDDQPIAGLRQTRRRTNSPETEECFDVLESILNDRLVPVRARDLTDSSSGLACLRALARIASDP